MLKTYLVYVNGTFVPAEEAKISIFDAAYLYGEGLFETLLAVQGKVLFLPWHFKRLYSGARQLKVPMTLKQSALEAALYKTMHVNDLQDAYLRINVSAEEAVIGARRRIVRDSHLVIIAKPPDPYPKELYQQGCRLVVVRSAPNDPLPIANIKTNNYLLKMMARREIAQRKADEGILLNTKGKVTEGAGSNLFAVFGQRIVTPPLSDGVLPGVTREQVMRIARRFGISCREQSLTVKRLGAADEIFITSTLKGVMPVATLEGRKLPRPIPGPITQQLMTRYRKESSKKTGLSRLREKHRR